MNKMLCRPLHRGISRRDTLAIQRLFSDGALGGYWPADPAYAYEDSAGTLAASVNGVTGLRFDVSRGLDNNVRRNIANYSEVLTKWIDVTAEFTITENNAVAPDGTMTADSVNVGGFGYQKVYPVITTNRTYTFSVYLWTLTGKATIGMRITDSSGTDEAHQTVNLTSTPTRYAITKTFGSNLSEIQIGIDNRAFAGGDTLAGYLCFWGGQLDIGNIATPYQKTLLLVGNGTHAIQATTANKPYLRQTPVSGKYWLDSNTETGALTATFSSSLGSACTIATVTPEGVSILENQTVGTTYNICPPYGYNSDILIINRALTPAEKALVTRVMQRSVPSLGSNLAVNGSFATDTDWTKGTGWSIDVTAAKSAGTASNLTQTLGVSGNQYRVTADITRTAGTVGAYNGTAQIGTTAATETAAKYAMKTTSTTVGFRADASFAGTVDNAVIQEIL